MRCHLATIRSDYGNLSADFLPHVITEYDISARQGWLNYHATNTRISIDALDVLGISIVGGTVVVSAGTCTPEGV